MEARVHEIAPDVFRLSVQPPDSPVNFGCFLIRDDQPAMVETGYRSMFPLFQEAVRKLIDPATLRYLIIPHFEMDECGSLNQFLQLAPRAEPVCSSVGSVVTMPDYSERPPKPVWQGDTLSLGRKTLRFVMAPWVHFWDSMLVYDETDGVLFCSDLFMQNGDREPITDEDRSQEVVETGRFYGAWPSQKHLEAALDRLEPLNINTLACHHGTVLKGDPKRYYRALRESVMEVVDAPFYSMRFDQPPQL